MDDLCSSSSYCHGSIRHDFPGRRKSRLKCKYRGPGEKASVDVSTGEKPGDTQERQQDQQTAVITQILAVAGTGDCNADISYYKKENGNWELKWTEKGYVGRNGNYRQ